MPNNFIVYLALQCMTRCSKPYFPNITLATNAITWRFVSSASSHKLNISIIPLQLLPFSADSDMFVGRTSQCTL